MEEMFRKKKKHNEGFTLAELLIVVAIIAVLVAISIPIFSTQLEKSREAVDLANLRSAYAVGCSKLITEDTDTDNIVTGQKYAYYIYDPASGKLLSNSEWNDLSNDEQEAAGVGKGTTIVGNSNNTFNDKSGIQYDPSEDVSGYPVLIWIYWDEQRVVASFMPPSTQP